MHLVRTNLCGCDYQLRHARGLHFAHIVMFTPQSTADGDRSDNDRVRQRRNRTSFDQQLRTVTGRPCAQF
jgi:hypothetical protein